MRICILAPFRTYRSPRSILLGFSPYAFVGIGGVGVSPSSAPDTSHATWSYGVGVHHDLLGWLGITAEARSRRSLHSDSVIAIGTSRNWEFRAGLSISFGGRHDDVGRDHGDRSHHAYRGRASWIISRRRSRRRELLPEFSIAPKDSSTRLICPAGTNPNMGFDAAGFVQYVFAQEGVSLPRTAHAIAELGEEISTTRWLAASR